jgi:hypothetical protein
MGDAVSIKIVIPLQRDSRNAPSPERHFRDMRVIHLCNRVRLAVVEDSAANLWAQANQFTQTVHDGWADCGSCPWFGHTIFRQSFPPLTRAAFIVRPFSFAELGGSLYSAARA